MSIQPLPPKPQRKPQTGVDPIVIIAVIAAVLILALAAIYYLRETPLSSGSVPAQQNLPRIQTDFSLPSLNGTLSTSDLRGKYVLVNFWATWCPPCISEMPSLHAYYTAHQDEGFTLIAVNYLEDVGTVRTFIESRGFTFPVALDTNGAVFAQYGGDSLPTSFLIGPDGKLVRAWEPGALTRSMLERDVTPLLKG